MKILGVQHPQQGSKWLLTVHEDSQGIPDRYPRFRPDMEINVRIKSSGSDMTLFKFYSGISPQGVYERPDGSFSLSFHTSK